LSRIPEPAPDGAEMVERGDFPGPVAGLPLQLQSVPEQDEGPLQLSQAAVGAADPGEQMGFLVAIAERLQDVPRLAEHAQLLLPFAEDGMDVGDVAEMLAMLPRVPASPSRSPSTRRRARAW